MSIQEGTTTPTVPNTACNSEFFKSKSSFRCAAIAKRNLDETHGRITLVVLLDARNWQ